VAAPAGQSGPMPGQAVRPCTQPHTCCTPHVMDLVSACTSTVHGGHSVMRTCGAAAVVAEQALVEHALRHTLVADALALQVCSAADAAAAAGYCTAQMKRCL
jgi:hypothetical protein